MDLNIDLKRIRETVTKKNFYIRTLVLIIGVLLITLNYNLFIYQNKFVIGGVGGIAIVVKAIFGVNPAVFISITSVVLIILAFMLLDIGDAMRAVIGSILYPLFISLTAPLAPLILKHLQFDSMIMVVLIAGILSGVGNGLIYKVGFNTGGSDIIMKIVKKYAKMPEGKAILCVNLTIMSFGAVIFGANKFIYALLILFLNTMIVDRILIGISSSKLFFIYTKEDEKVKNFIINELKTGVTIFNATGGYTHAKNHVLMCVVPTKDYYLFKETVLAIDCNAFFVINDCYEVSGGVRQQNLPFI